MARFFYSLCVALLLPVAVIYLLWRARQQPEYLQHWRERFGLFNHLQHRTNAPLIWLHAVSVGETRAAQPLISALRERFPTHEILITHMTPTGRATSLELFGESVERCYLPYDTPWAMQRFLRHFSPQFGIVMETELWPNLVTTCAQREIPLMLVNARLSAKSQAGYAKLAALARATLQGLRAIAAQSADDANRLISLGAGEVKVVGNIKFDIEPPQNQIALGNRLREQIGSRQVFLAASTREGEELLLLDAWARNLPVERPLLIVVPRHPQRFKEVAEMIQAKGLRIQRRSENPIIDPQTEVLLGDSMGEMFAWHRLADVAFIGGSLLNFGSQNLIEACAVGTPVLLGPSTYNFSEAAHEAQACGAALAITDADDLVEKALRLLKNTDARAQMSAAGLAFAHHHRGATTRTMEIIVRTVA